MTRFLLGASLLVAVSACATGLSEEQCLTGDARNVGYDDGRQGKSIVGVETRVEQCARFDVGFDRDGYQVGWNEGNAVFCTPRGALEVALKGEGDIRNCAQADSLTYDAFRVGREFHRAQKAYERADERYESLISTIRNRRYDIDRTAIKLRDEPDANQRKELAQRIERFRRDVREAQDDLPYASREARDAERDYDRARYRLDDLEDEIRRSEYDRSF